MNKLFAFLLVILLVISVSGARRRRRRETQAPEEQTGISTDLDNENESKKVVLGVLDVEDEDIEEKEEKIKKPAFHFADGSHDDYVDSALTAFKKLTKDDSFKIKANRLNEYVMLTLNPDNDLLTEDELEIINDKIHNFKTDNGLHDGDIDLGWGFLNAGHPRRFVKDLVVEMNEYRQRRLRRLEEENEREL